jgi:hypothetical protein
MDPFDTIIILAGVCGVGMVFGSMVLLFKGIINLQAASGGAMNVGLQRLIKIETTVPALGLFVIGLVFILSAAAMSRPDGVSPVQIKGQIRPAGSSSVSILIRTEQGALVPSTDGQIQGVIYPHMGGLTVEITAPGYSTPLFRKTIMPQEIRSGVASIGDVDLGQPVKNEPPVRPENVATPAVPLPPVSDAGRL